jgi:hypothetical protein
MDKFKLVNLYPTRLAWASGGRTSVQHATQADVTAVEDAANPVWKLASVAPG